MSNPITIWQGADKIINVEHDYTGLPDATEIEVYIDTKPQIVKSLSGGGITNVTVDSYTVTITDEDSQSKQSGEYRIQARITASNGLKLFGYIAPGRVRLKDSVFTVTE